MEDRDNTKYAGQSQRPKSKLEGRAKPIGPMAPGPVDLSAIDLNSELPHASGDFDFAGLPDFADPGSAGNSTDPFANADPFAASDPFAINGDSLAAAPSSPAPANAGPASGVPAGKQHPQSKPVLGTHPMTPTPSLVGAAATVGGVEIAAEQPAEFDLDAVQRRKFFWTAVPSWSISLMVHVAVLFVLAAVSLQDVQKVISILQASSGEAAAEIDNFDLQGPTAPMELAAADEPISPPVVNTVVAMPEVTQAELTPISTAFSDVALTSTTENLLPSAMLSSAMNTMK